MFKRFPIGAIILLILLAFFLRIHRLDAVNLRGDEAYSVVHWTATPFSDAWWTLIKNEPAPIGAFTAYHIWASIAGTSEFGIRMLSVLGSTAGVAILMALAHRLFADWRPALATGFIVALNPHLLWHAQDARVYGMLTALTPLTFYCLLHAIQKGKSDNSIRPWIPYILVQTLALYLYYFEGFWMLAGGVYVLWIYINGQQKLLRQAIRAWMIVGVLYIPVVIQVIYLMFISEYTGNASDASLSLLFSQFIPTLLFGENTIPVYQGIIFIGLLAGLLIYQMRQTPQAGLLLAWCFVPLILLYLVSFQSSFFRPRYVMTVTPALLLAILWIGWQLAPRFNWQLSAVLILTVGISGISGYEAYQYFYHDDAKAPQWQALTSYLEARTSPDDVVITGDIDPALEYYYTGNIFFLPLENPDPEDDYQWLLNNYNGLFLLSGERMQNIQDYLQKNAQYIPAEPDNRITHYRSWDVQPSEIAHTVDVTFGETAALQGYTILYDQHKRPTHLFLYWEALQRTTEEQSILVHLVEEMEGIPVATLDHGLANSIISLTQWQPGTLYRDPIILPRDMPSGDYIVRVGVYNTQTVETLPVITPRNAQDYAGRYPLFNLHIP